MDQIREVVTRVRGFHHVGIQTGNLDNAALWYQAFLQCAPSWTLREFSELTQARLPGTRELRELVYGTMRFHLFERPGEPAPLPQQSLAGFQHLCLSVEAPEDLVALRERWIRLYRSGEFSFALPDQPTDIVVDADGVQSFYAYDVNGVEFEFTYVPEAA